MISPLFNTSAHFVDKDLYRKFFAHRINEAERIFRESLETLQSQIDANLKPEFFDDLEPLDRPYFGSSLQAQLAAKSAESEAAKEKVSSQLAEVQRELKKSEKKRRNVEAALARKARKKASRQGKKRKKQKKK